MKHIIIYCIYRIINTMERFSYIHEMPKELRCELLLYMGSHIYGMELQKKTWYYDILNSDIDDSITWTKIFNLNFRQQRKLIFNNVTFKSISCSTYITYAYYIQQLPNELQAELLLYIGIDTNILRSICNANVITRQLWANDNKIWKRMIACHITSDISTQNNLVHTREHYFDIIKQALSNIKADENSQFNLINLLQRYKADLLLRQLIKLNPDLFSEIRLELLESLIDKYAIDRRQSEGRIYQINIPKNFLPILLEDNDEEAGLVLAMFILMNISFMEQHKTQYEELIESIVHKISIPTFLSTLQSCHAVSLLNELGIAKYFQQ